ncbi:ABC transporter permease [Microbacterium sp.]|uniref:ABC transporter permease n=1 Tax=Microbacterium sp. TaxID=51671 RepID=UPI003F6FA7E0
MMPFILRRVGFYVIAAWIGVTINFLLPRLMPGDAATAAFAAQYQKLSSNPAALEQIRAAFGITDDPIWVQYGQYLGGLFTGNLGVSYTFFPTSVSDVIAQSLPWTIALVGCAALIAFVIGSLVGILAAWRRGGFVDTFFPPFALFLGAFPAFFLGLLLLYFFSVQLGWLPSGHGYTPGIPPSWQWTSILDLVSHAVLPAATIVFISIGGWILSMRNTMVSVLNEDYITLAEARGLSQRRVMFGYAARNALLPQLTGLALALGFLVGGQVLVEYVYTYPGLGSILAYAVGSKDYPLIQGMLLAVTMCVLAANFLIDIAYLALDPRTREVAVG